MLETFLKETGSLLLVPIAMIVAGLYLTKGVYGLHRSRSQDRKDFLDLWLKADKADDLWLQVAVRHLVGENLPSPLIRHLMTQPHAARSLSDVAFAWRLIDMDEVSGELRWRRPRHGSLRVRVWERRIWLLGYFILAGAALGAVCFALIAETKSVMSILSWIWALLMGCCAYWSLVRAERLQDANLSVPRWTAKLRWKEGGGNEMKLRPARRSNKRA